MARLKEPFGGMSQVQQTPAEQEGAGRVGGPTIVGPSMEVDVGYPNVGTGGGLRVVGEGLKLPGR